MANSTNLKINIVEENIALKEILKRYFSSKKNVKLSFLDFDELINNAKGIVRKKEKIIVDISRSSIYIQEIASMEKNFFNNSNLFILLVNERQLIELKSNVFLSGRFLLPNDLQQIKKNLEI